MTVLQYGQIRRMTLYSMDDLMNRPVSDFKKYLGVDMDPQEIFARRTGRFWDEMTETDLRNFGSDEELIAMIFDVLPEVFTLEAGDGIDDVNLMDYYLIERLPCAGVEEWT